MEMMRRIAPAHQQLQLRLTAVARYHTSFRSFTAVPSPPGTRIIYSRRVVQQQQQHAALPPKKRSLLWKALPKGFHVFRLKFAQSSSSDRWPRNWRIAGYTAGFTMIPYLFVWTTIQDPSWRPRLYPQLERTTGVETEQTRVSWLFRFYNALRRHFGTPEVGNGTCTTSHDGTFAPFPNATSYTDRVYIEDGQDVPVAYCFRDEDPARTRQLQRILETNHDNPQRLVRTRLYAVADPGSPPTDQIEVDLPSSTRINAQTLNQLWKENQRNLDKGAALTLTDYSIAIDFLPDIVAAEEASPPVSTGDSVGPGGESLSEKKDSLIDRSSVRSLWHLEHDHGKSGTEAANNKGTQKFSAKDYEESQLQYQIQQLEWELQNSASSKRPIDDIVTDLQEAKRRLRSIQWKRWSLWRN
jgi:hypothetical protein